MTLDTAQPALTAADRSWFGDRVERLLPDLYGAAVRLCGDRTDAEDLVAEAITRAWAGLPGLQDRSSFRAWLFRILNNTFVSHCRSAEAKAVHEPLDSGEPEPFSLFERLHQPILMWWGNPERGFLNRLLREDLEHAIDGLPDPFREVVVMVDVEGLRYREVADVLDLPIGTVRSRLSRGRSLLQRALWDHAQTAGLREGPPPDAQTESNDED